MPRLGTLPAVTVAEVTDQQPVVPHHVEFYLDPICPFAWITSRWVVEVARQRPLRIEWRFIALRLLNDGRNYETDFPAGYTELHTKGLRMLRVCAAAREHAGNDAVGQLYTALGESIWNRSRGEQIAGNPLPGSMDLVATDDHLHAALRSSGLPRELASAADREDHDALLLGETEQALSRAGRDVGTPIIAVDPPDGPAFFGPVISRLPGADEAVELWDTVMKLARWPGFAELKRSLREMPDLPLLRS